MELRFFINLTNWVPIGIISNIKRSSTHTWNWKHWQKILFFNSRKYIETLLMTFTKKGVLQNFVKRHISSFTDHFLRLFTQFKTLPYTLFLLFISSFIINKTTVIYIILKDYRDQSLKGLKTIQGLNYIFWSDPRKFSE